MKNLKLASQAADVQFRPKTVGQQANPGAEVPR